MAERVNSATCDVITRALEGVEDTPLQPNTNNRLRFDQYVPEQQQDDDEFGPDQPDKVITYENARECVNEELAALPTFFNDRYLLMYPRQQPTVGVALFRPFLVFFFVGVVVKVILTRSSAPVAVWYLFVIPVMVAIGFIVFYSDEWRIRHELEFHSRRSFIVETLKRYSITAMFGLLAYAFVAIDMATTVVGMNSLERESNPQWYSAVSIINILCCVPPLLLYSYVVSMGIARKRRRDKATQAFGDDVLPDEMSNSFWIRNKMNTFFDSRPPLGLAVFGICVAAELTDAGLGFYQYISHSCGGKPCSGNVVYLIFACIKYMMLFAYPILISWQIDKIVMAGEFGRTNKHYRMMSIGFQLRLLCVVDIFTDIAFFLVSISFGLYHVDGARTFHFALNIVLIVKAAFILIIDLPAAVWDVRVVIGVLHTAPDPFVIHAKTRRIVITCNELVPYLNAIIVNLARYYQAVLSEPQVDITVIRMSADFRHQCKRLLGVPKYYQECRYHFDDFNLVEGWMRGTLSRFQQMHSRLLRDFPRFDTTAAATVLKKVDSPTYVSQPVSQGGPMMMDDSGLIHQSYIPNYGFQHQAQPMGPDKMQYQHLTSPYQENPYSYGSTSVPLVPPSDLPMQSPQYPPAALEQNPYESNSVTIVNNGQIAVDLPADLSDRLLV